MADLLVRGGEVLADGGLRRADVLVQHGEITRVAAGIDPPDRVEVLAADDMVVVPGLINAHMHSGENLNPGLYENLPLDLWFVHSHQVTRTEPLSHDGIYLRTLLGAALMLCSGTTTAVDFLYEAPEITLQTLGPVVQAYRDAGLRATILLGVADLPYTASLPLSPTQRDAVREPSPPAAPRIMELAHAAVDRWHQPDGSIGIGLGPSAPQRCSEALLDATLELARARGLVWQTHVLETKSQAYTSRCWYGRSFVEHLDDRGALGPESTLVHTVWLSDRDIERMSARGTPAVHCLVSNLRLGDGVARLPALRDAGVRVALGTDGRGCDETLDMLELTRATALVHKARGGDFRRWPTAREALAMSTSDASPCTGHGERLGRIEPGAHGDLVLIPSSAPCLVPLHDAVRQLVYGAGSRDVDTVIVDGRVVVRGGRPLGIDMERIARDAPGYARESLAGERACDAARLASLVEKMYLGIEREPLDHVHAYLRC